MSYYKIIQGVRYDRRLLEAAEAAINGPGDGRISRQDAQQLMDFLLDGGKITEVERRTIEYILTQFRWTEPARSWFLQTYPQQQAGVAQSLDSILQQVVRETMDLSQLSLLIHEVDVEEQSTQLRGNISFAAALEATLKALLVEEHQGVNPRYLLRETFGEELAAIASEAERAEALTEKVRSFLNEGELQLLPNVDFEAEEEAEDWDFNPPADGECVAENWIFTLYLPSLSDHIYWVVVDRSGERAAYVYGLN